MEGHDVVAAEPQQKNKTDDRGACETEAPPPPPPPKGGKDGWGLGDGGWERREDRGTWRWRGRLFIYLWYQFFHPLTLLSLSLILSGDVMYTIFISSSLPHHSSLLDIHHPTTTPNPSTTTG
jgi:hypothetical protein